MGDGEECVADVAELFGEEVVGVTAGDLDWVSLGCEGEIRERRVEVGQGRG